MARSQRPTTKPRRRFEANRLRSRRPLPQMAAEIPRQNIKTAGLSSFGDYCRGDNLGVGSLSLLLHFLPKGSDQVQFPKAQVFWPARLRLPAGGRGGQLFGRPGNPYRLEARWLPLPDRLGQTSRLGTRWPCPSRLAKQTSRPGISSHIRS